FASDHLRLISSVLGSIVAGILIVWGLLYYFDRVAQEAFAILFQAESGVRNVESGNDLPPALVDRLQQVGQTLGAGRARGYAQLYLGHIYYRKGDYAAALASYRQALAQVGQPSVLWSLAALGVAYALEASGDLKGAQDAYQRVIDANPAGFVTEAYVGKGRAAEGGNDLETAIAVYSAVIEKFPLQAETLGIADKVAALKARVERSMGQ
ncbi:MAG: tetratricopeptide repeat protein, partial [Nitrospinae bacterium]|nr:tetratricopeptide repeat protein [Nitrospinota bacterium]